MHIYNFYGKIKEIASKPLSITLDTLATTARNLLYKTKKRTVFVTDDKERPVGLITLKTILSLAVLRSNLYAKDIMERPVTMIDEDEELENAAKRMVKTGLKETAVVKDGKLTGIVDVINMVQKIGRKTNKSLMDIASKNPDSIDVKTPLPKIIGKLKKHATLPVTKEKKIVGILTRAEVARRRFQARDLNSCVTADRIMKTPVISVETTDDLDHVIKIILEHKVHALPVVEKEEPAGIITRLDILKEKLR